MLKITESTESAANSKETEDRLVGNSVVGDMVRGNKATNSTKEINLVKTTKSKILVKSKTMIFLSLGLRKSKQAFLPPKLD